MDMRYMVQTPMEVHIPEELMNARFRGCACQPILENAILHGFAAEKKWGRIAICAWESEGYLQIDVLDDGMGMADDAIQRLNARLESGEAERPASALSIRICVFACIMARIAACA